MSSDCISSDRERVSADCDTVRTAVECVLRSVYHGTGQCNRRLLRAESVPFRGEGVLPGLVEGMCGALSLHTYSNNRSSLCIAALSPTPRCFASYMHRYYDAARLLIPSPLISFKIRVVIHQAPSSGLYSWGWPRHQFG